MRLIVSVRGFGKHLRLPCTLELICGKLQAEYEESSSRCEADVAALIGQRQNTVGESGGAGRVMTKLFHLTRAERGLLFRQHAER